MHLPDLNIAKDRTRKENQYIYLKEVLGISKEVLDKILSL